MWRCFPTVNISTTCDCLVLAIYRTCVVGNNSVSRREFYTFTDETKHTHSTNKTIWRFRSRSYTSTRTVCWMKLFQISPMFVGFKLLNWLCFGKGLESQTIYPRARRRYAGRDNPILQKRLSSQLSQMSCWGWWWLPRAPGTWSSLMHTSLVCIEGCMVNCIEISIVFIL